MTVVLGFCVVATSSAALLSPADSFARQPERSVEGQPEDAAPGELECIEAAKGILLEERDALKLCGGATSRAPVACFKRADRLTLLEETLLVDLCTCAASTKPADCYVTTDEKVDLSEREIVAMCNVC